MSRVRPFVLRVDVSEEFLREQPKMARALAREALIDQGHQPLTGPRGGRYEPVNEPHHFWETYVDDAYIRGERTFTALVTGRYVRPSA